MRVGSLIVSLVFLVAGMSSAALAETVRLSAERDNTLIESPTGALSNGSGPSIFAGNNGQPSTRRAAIAFDVAAAIPAGSQVTAVRLTLYMSQSNAGPETVAAHRLLAGWGEGTSSSGGGGGSLSAPGDATWVHTFYDTQFWMNPGGDFEPTPSAGFLVGGPGAYTLATAPGLLEDVQLWLDDPARNHGWLLVGDETGPTTVKRFSSRQNPDPAQHPVLVVEFVPPPGDDEDEDEDSDEGDDERDDDPGRLHPIREFSQAAEQGSGESGKKTLYAD